ncbi:tRNA-dihydrouridine synthase family protein [Laribacter hongkongensis]|uniref:tRNA dihydrouridine synthase n=1 Tax=Laribacter hongkongensis TaxID=168471 RepID=UPI0004809EB9|nr:tRNA-dihydrouridine synthase family protein [Laribacter hongkongensis]MCG9063856.1 tRNA-dihydrouridine synthase family protein [Laribacter hongkongensis]
MPIALAPMEGLVDAPLRDLITRMGGVDWCVTEFLRVTGSLLPAAAFRRIAPEHAHGWRTPAGTPVRLQLLGSDPASLADNAARGAELGAPVLDLNFGCPAPTVNKHGGGAALLDNPGQLYRIASAVRAALPAGVPLTAKMRLGLRDTELTLDCARALDSAGISELVVHARTKVEGYRPPAHWQWVAQVKEVVAARVWANGEVWNLQDWQDIRRESGVDDIMIGRGLVVRPDLAYRIAATNSGAEVVPLDWNGMLELLKEMARHMHDAAPQGNYLPFRLKQWLKLLMLPGGWPCEAGELFQQIRGLTRASDCLEVLSRTRETVQ